MQTIPRIDLANVTRRHIVENDPPGMWTGYNLVLSSNPPMYYPRAGIRGFELSIKDDAVPFEEVEGLARILAWERYLAAHRQSNGAEIPVSAFLQP